MYLCAIIAFAVLCGAAGAFPSPVRDEHIVLSQLVRMAERSSSNGGFWSSTLKKSADKCSPDYYDKLLANFNDIMGAQDPNMVQMYQMLDKNIVHYCDRQFLPYSKRITDLCKPGSDCDRVASGHKLTADWDQAAANTMVQSVAQVMRRTAGAGIASPDQFTQVYLNRGPCSAIYHTLDQRYMRDYRQYFLSLVSLPNYYVDFDRQHQQAADIVAACNRIQTTTGLLEAAFNYYAQL